jgi:hypothetical protein
MSAVVAFSGLTACNNFRIADELPGTTPFVPVGNSSFALLQEKILTPNCATSGCHANANSGGGLDLSPAVAYRNLVNVAPTNTNAKTDKLLRVKPNDPNKSFLYIKLDSLNLHTSDGYGDLMPLGSRTLTRGQMEFLRQWIIAGAPLEGAVADASLLDDTRNQNEVITLPPPAQGLQFRVAPFRVPPQKDREIFIAQANTHTQDLFMTRFEMAQRDRSHHFILYGYPRTATARSLIQPGVVRDLYNSNYQVNIARFLEMQDREFIMGAQTKNADISFPPGMAMRIPADWLLDFNSHYSNGLRDSIAGEVVFNLHTTTRDKVQNVLKPLQLNNISFTLPAQRETTIETIYRVGTRGNYDNDTLVRVVGLTSHAHQLSRRFVVQIVGGARDGEIVYSSTNYLNPPIVWYNTPIILRRNEGLKSVVTYFNNTSQAVRFGLRAEDEMNIIFGWFY